MDYKRKSPLNVGKSCYPNMLRDGCNENNKHNSQEAI